MLSPQLPTSITFDEVSDIKFDMVKEKAEFRNYDHNPLQELVKNTYLKMHTYQTYDYVVQKKKQYSALATGLEVSIWEASEMLNDIIDESDPDVDTPQIHHALQTAEAIRKVYPGEEWDWLHLTGFIHDLGKLLLHPKFAQPQWASVGDTFPVGCRFHESNVFAEFFKHNPDNGDSRYNTENGVYEPGCGLDNILMSWSHDEYMYQVCKGNNSTLPPQALYIIRFHSFYPWHKHGAYSHLANEHDREMLKWVWEFNKFDLYSKDNDPVDVQKLKPYYEKLAKKYFPDRVKF